MTLQSHDAARPKRRQFVNVILKQVLDSHKLRCIPKVRGAAEDIVERYIATILKREQEHSGRERIDEREQVIDTCVERRGTAVGCRSYACCCRC